MSGIKALFLKPLIAALLLAALCGCWDSTNLESVEYATALGIDYKDGKFIVIAQMIDFASVAKTEGKMGQPSNVWIGKGDGETFYSAYNELLKTSQTEMNIEQLKTVIVRQPAMLKMDEILDALNRVRVARYTSWVFGTRGDIVDIFTTDNFFGMPQTTSLIYSPTEQMRRSNVIMPLNMQRFVAMYNEEASTVILPAVGVQDNTWRMDKKTQNMQVIEGVFAIKDKGTSGYYKLEQISGVKWMNPHFTRYLIPINDREEGKATVALQDVRNKIKVKIEGGKPVFTIRLRMTGEVAELSGNLNKQKIIDIVSAKIEDEVRATYLAGLERGDDLLNLETALYRKQNKVWKQQAKKKEWLPGKDDLKIEVQFKLRSSGGFILH
ncbi:Ger(x)C family germination protein [Paenibacillus phyllosphaerae]|uniref:Ger(X)C family germination protein n=1 Tax=Paenibacillus phyllosphaerae TaxID=274593 RepID=A0A7W5FM26_9BACL|nr:Ger(x)C family spore germination protein [Paenibacillus phyllosphaerae]MBB3109826.1 Ger(x)C family germination protein [Paenibacillus phyllosphaerae]